MLSGVTSDNGRTIVEMSIEVPPFIAAPFRADALAVLKLRNVNGGDAKSLVIGRTSRQPKVAVLAAMHRSGFSWLYRPASKLIRNVARLSLRSGSSVIVG